MITHNPSTQDFSVGQTVTSDYFGEALIEEIIGHNYLLRATDGTGRCMYHWADEFSASVMPFDAVLLVDNYGTQEAAIVLSTSSTDAYVQFADGSCLWVGKQHVTRIVARNVRFAA